MKYNEIWKDSFDEKIHQFTTAEETVQDTHAILVLTEWDEFLTLPYSDFYSKMHKPAYIFDGRNLLEE